MNRFTVSIGRRICLLKKPLLKFGNLFPNVRAFTSYETRKQSPKACHNIPLVIPAIGMWLDQYFQKVLSPARAGRHLQRNRARCQTGIYKFLPDILIVNVAPHITSLCLKSFHKLLQTIHCCSEFYETIGDRTARRQQRHKCSIDYFTAADNLGYQNRLSVQIDRSLSQSIIKHVVILLHELIKLILYRFKSPVSSKQSSSASYNRCKCPSNRARETKPLFGRSCPIRTPYRPGDTKPSDNSPNHYEANRARHSHITVNFHAPNLPRILILVERVAA